MLVLYVIITMIMFCICEKPLAFGRRCVRAAVQRMSELFLLSFPRLLEVILVHFRYYHWTSGVVTGLPVPLPVSLLTLALLVSLPVIPEVELTSPEVVLTGQFGSGKTISLFPRVYKERTKCYCIIVRPEQRTRDED